jgi:DNA-directed RNA polymerase specialized sigma subunit
LEAERAEKEKEKQRRQDTRVNDYRSKRSGTANRGPADDKFDESDEAILKPKKGLDKYEKLFATKTEFFSTYSPDMIEDAVVGYLRNQKQIEPKSIHKDKYKVKFEIVTKSQEVGGGDEIKP